MVAIAVVTLFVAILAGMGISVCAFGTGGKRPKVFEDIYFSVEDVNGMGISEPATLLHRIPLRAQLG